MNKDQARKARQIFLIMFLSFLGTSITLGFFDGHWILSAGVLVNLVIFFLAEWFSVKKYGATISTKMTKTVEAGGKNAILSFLQGILLALSFVFLALHFYVIGR